jgi:hypothetical protein
MREGQRPDLKVDLPKGAPIRCAEVKKLIGRSSTRRARPTWRHFAARDMRIRQKAQFGGRAGRHQSDRRLNGHGEQVCAFTASGVSRSWREEPAARDRAVRLLTDQTTKFGQAAKMIGDIRHAGR